MAGVVALTTAVEGLQMIELTDEDRAAIDKAWDDVPHPPQVTLDNVVFATAMYLTGLRAGMERAIKAVDDAGGDNCEYHMNAIREAAK